LDEAGLAAWRETDRYEVFHHAENARGRIRYAIYEDAQRYDSAHSVVTPRPRVPGIGRNRGRPGDGSALRGCAPAMSLRMVDDDHQLGASSTYVARRWRILDCRTGTGRGGLMATET